MATATTPHPSTWSEVKESKGTNVCLFVFFQTSQRTVVKEAEYCKGEDCKVLFEY